MKIGNVGISWSFTKHPFSLWLRTTYFVMGHPVEGPKYVRQLTHWLWLIVSWDASKKHLDAAIKNWNADENAELRAHAKAEFERITREVGNVPSIH